MTAQPMTAYERLQFDRHRALLQAARRSQEAETFVSLAGTAIEEAEACASAYTLPWDVLHDHAIRLREAADQLANLALEMK